MNTIAMILVLLGSGLKDGIVNGAGKYEERCPDGYEFVHAGYEWRPCYVIDKAVSYGIHNYQVYDFVSQRVNDQKLTFYAYQVKVKLKDGSEEPRWFYFSLSDEEELEQRILNRRKR